MITGCTGGDDGNTPIKPTKRITEGKYAPKLKVKSRYKLANGEPFEKGKLYVDQDIWLPPVSGDTPNWNIVGDNRIRKVFKIDVGNIPDEEVEDYVRKVAERFKKATQIQPDLDCGIYPDDNELFLPSNIEKIMPEQPDLQKIHDALYPKSSSAHYMHVIPNSHFWTDLMQISYSIDHELLRQEREKEVKDNSSIYIGEPLTADYILIGLGNSLMRGYNLKHMTKTGYSNELIFVSIEDMISYIQSGKFILKNFRDAINNTIKVGINLTNGIKMEREHVYKRIDGERKYQDIVGKSGQRGDTPDEEKPVSEWVNYIEYYLSKAKEKIYHLRKDDALEEIRKVAALAVRAMEIHGCPERRMPDRIGNITVNSDGTVSYGDTYKSNVQKDNCCGGDCDCKK